MPRALNGGRVLRDVRLEVGRRGRRVILRFTQPVTHVELTGVEAVEAALRIYERAIQAARITLPGDLGDVARDPGLLVKLKSVPQNDKEPPRNDALRK